MRTATIKQRNFSRKASHLISGRSPSTPSGDQLGKVLSRTPKATNYTKSLPGAPVGDYVVIQYESSFEHKPSAIETVTFLLDVDGKYRVSGYSIK